MVCCSRLGARFNFRSPPSLLPLSAHPPLGPPQKFQQEQKKGSMTSSTSASSQPPTSSIAKSLDPIYAQAKFKAPPPKWKAFITPKVSMAQETIMGKPITPAQLEALSRDPPYSWRPPRSKKVPEIPASSNGYGRSGDQKVATTVRDSDQECETGSQEASRKQTPEGRSDDKEIIKPDPESH